MGALRLRLYNAGYSTISHKSFTFNNLATIFALTALTSPGDRALVLSDDDRLRPSLAFS